MDMQTKTPSPAVLGISIGTRKIGLAVMQKGQLLESKVAAFKGPWSDEKLASIMQCIQKCKEHFTASAIAMKIPNIAHHTDGLQTLITAIQHYCSTQKLKVQVYTITELKEALLSDRRKTKRALVAFIGEKYTELYKEYRKEYSNRNKHYTKMFEAIAAAELFSREHLYF